MNTPEDLIEKAKRVVNQGPDVTYPSRAAAQHVRDVMGELVEMVEGAGKKFKQFTDRHADREIELAVYKDKLAFALAEIAEDRPSAGTVEVFGKWAERLLKKFHVTEKSDG